MVEQVTFQTIFQFLQTVGILVGVYYYIMTIRTNQRNQELARKAQEQALETRQAQLFMQVYNQWTTGIREWNEIRRWAFDDYDDFQKMLDDLESRNKFSSVTQFLEGLGVLVREGLIPIRLVSLYITSLVRIYWEKFGPMIEEYRERENIPRAVGEAEYLYRTVMKYVEEHPELRT